MPSMQELSATYRSSADALRSRIGELRKMEKAAKDDAEAGRLHRRVLDLLPLYKEASALATLTERYYERGYHKDEEYTL